MFKQWRGSIILHLKIVASKFQKGRLKISYDPRNDISTTSPSTNTVYTQILDIGETDDVDIEIPYHQDTPWLDVPSFTGNNYGLTATPPVIGQHNGVLTIRVLTNLTAPATSSIGIILSVRGGNDLEFANPVDALPTYYPASLMALQASEKVDIKPLKWVMGADPHTHKDRYGLNFGEDICSLRNILHRSSSVKTEWLLLSASSMNWIRKLVRIMPASPGFDTNANFAVNKIVATTGTAKYNCAPFHPMTYISAPFLGYRGGATFTFTPNCPYQYDMFDIRAVRGCSTSTLNDCCKVDAIPASASGPNRAIQITQTIDRFAGNSGMAITATKTNNSLVFNVPDFKKYNFSLFDPSKFITGNSADGTDTSCAIINALVPANSSAEVAYTFTQLEECAGPDFTCLFFLNCPTLDITNRDITAA